MTRDRRGIILKSAREIELMRTANQHLAEILQRMCEAAKPGVCMLELDTIARAEINKRPVESAFLGYGGYPAVVCTSVNEVIVHGIPRKDVVLKDGDIIGIDFGVVYKGYVGDSARTLPVGEVAPGVLALVDTTERGLIVIGIIAAVAWEGHIRTIDARPAGLAAVAVAAGGGVVNLVKIDAVNASGG